MQLKMTGKHKPC